jgi:tRNA A37 threonylcarbamoyladenosine synthetase subunit TsaC/SUA5/YrdC
VVSFLGAGIDLVLDGGKAPGGPGSTILDVTVSPPRLLREGMIPGEQLAAFLRSPPEPPPFTIFLFPGGSFQV